MSHLLHRPNEDYVVQLLTERDFLDDIEQAFPQVRAKSEQRDEEMWDDYLEEYLSDIEDNLDEFLEEKEEDFTPYIVEIDLDDFEIHVGGK
jgi:signal transduction protein with GAF and PtsI domain